MAVPVAVGVSVVARITLQKEEYKLATNLCTSSDFLAETSVRKVNSRFNCPIVSLEKSIDTLIRNVNTVCDPEVILTRILRAT